MIGLIGYTGTVGKTIREHLSLELNEQLCVYNSKNIDDICGTHFDILYIAGIKANKWIANQNEEDDLKSINNLLYKLRTVTANKSVLISTIDIHSNDNYGRDRSYAETEILNMKNLNCKIIRLPGLVGKNIKKNFIYDIAHPEKDLSFTSINSSFIFYNLDNIMNDINDLLNSSCIIKEIGGEPVNTREICDLLNIDKNKLNNSEGVQYHSLFKGLTKEEQLELIKNYVKNVSVNNRC